MPWWAVGFLIIFGFTVTYASIPAARKLALRWDLIAPPVGRRNHSGYPVNRGMDPVSAPDRGLSDFFCVGPDRQVQGVAPRMGADVVPVFGDHLDPDPGDH